MRSVHMPLLRGGGCTVRKYGFVLLVQGTLSEINHWPKLSDKTMGNLELFLNFFI